MNSSKNQWLEVWESDSRKYWAEMNPLKRFWLKKIYYPGCRGISWLRYDTVNGVRGLLYWAKFAWRWRSWDSHFALAALQHSLKALEPVLRNGHAMYGSDRADEVKAAVALLDRILKSDYILTDNDPECLSREFSLKVQNQANRRDLKELTRIMNKSLYRWWD